MSTSMLISLAQRYHAFSGSSLKTLTLPTLGASSGVAGSIEVVQEPAAEPDDQPVPRAPSPEPIVTPPLDAYGSPVTVPSTTTTTTTPSSQTSAEGTGVDHHDDGAGYGAVQPHPLLRRGRRSAGAGGAPARPRRGPGPGCSTTRWRT